MRLMPELAPQEGFALVDLSGTAAEVGRALGDRWRIALEVSAQSNPTSTKPWWTMQPYRKLVSKYAAYLPVFYENMAAAAKVPLWAVAADLNPNYFDQTPEGCTSFAVAPSFTLDRVPISGQTKDTSIDRLKRYQVLRLKMTDAPSHLSLTYPGWLYGHGFIQGGCTLFRNKLYCPNNTQGLPYALFGLLALHCPSVEDVSRIARDHGVKESAHIVVADEQGGIAGLEFTNVGVFALKPKQGVYTHANCVLKNSKAQRAQTFDADFTYEDSICRTNRIASLLGAHRNSLTAQLAMQALGDGGHMLNGITKVTNPDVMTTATIVAQPSRGLLHITRGSAAQHWPMTYSL